MENLKRKTSLILCLFIFTVCLSGCVSSETTVETSAETTSEIISETSEETTTSEEFVLLPNEINNMPEFATVTVCAVGDNLIHSPIYIQASRLTDETDSYNFSPAYENVADLISSRDLAMINQETLICNDIYPPSNYPNFNSPVALGTHMLDMGFTVFSIANNHTLDQGTAGLAACLDYWENTDAVVAGAYRNSADRANIRTNNINSVTFSYLSYTEHLNGYSLPPDTELEIGDAKDVEAMTAEIRAAKQISDVCVVFLHWGIEGSSAITAEQRKTALLLAEAGADVILGTHPHVLRDIEFIEKADGSRALCAYSLGNFISAQDIPQTMIGGVLNFDIILNTNTHETQIENVNFIPTITHYDDGYRNVRIFKLEEYTEELAAAHGVRANGRFSMDYIHEILSGSMNLNSQSVFSQNE